MEISLTPRKKREFEVCYDMNIELSDKTYHTWRRLKENLSEDPKYEEILIPIHQESSAFNHPLAKVGLIPEDLVNVLVVPQTASKP